MKAEQRPLLIVASLIVAFFTILSLFQGNYEFLVYIAVILLMGWLILVSDKYVNWPTSILWHLLTWMTLHLAGGGVKVGSGVLYSWVMVPLVGAPYSILKYDQVVHVYGFFVATLVAYRILERHLKTKHVCAAVGITVVMAGLGLGAVNEIIEFAATVIVPETNVGGYVNTALDLVADLIGALIALWYLKRKVLK